VSAEPAARCLLHDAGGACVLLGGDHAAADQQLADVMTDGQRPDALRLERLREAVVRAQASGRGFSDGQRRVDLLAEPGTFEVRRARRLRGVLAHVQRRRIAAIDVAVRRRSGCGGPFVPVRIVPGLALVGRVQVVHQVVEIELPHSMLTSMAPSRGSGITRLCEARCGIPR
jgi:hypothetical protein